MQVVGFSFTKIAGNKDKHSPKIAVDANIKFNEISKQKVDILKDAEAIKLTFSHFLNYNDSEKKDKEKLAEITFDGIITLNVSKEESRDIMKAWKKKQLPQETTLFLYNFILRKCAPKALQLQDELNLPSHIQVPKLSANRN